ncbi:telomere repeats-binding bouquet formation protein 2 isoform X1 [Gadus morhua]|uniref:telomere repeats-binding bouquet formation protein 2 isoform X1 n=1 Tax=Gadus morhua TaxID=8049 RepID=UPI0011B4E80D|nr:telomere repeats-binding bouquet formation protein 2 isoform X1 [Gadus morhua]
MFRKRTAWFSNSVERRCQKYWVSDVCIYTVSEGGRIASWRKAEYLFSEDASNPDTQRIFESKDYQQKKVTVFHSLFLCACEKRDSAGSVCIGHYVLPPVCVQDEVRNVVGRLIWEREDDQFEPQGSSAKQVEEDSWTTTDLNSSCEHLDSETPPTVVKVCCEVQELSFNKPATGYISINKLAKYSGDLCEITPDHCGC